jgi:hypothetical protein
MTGSVVGATNMRRQPKCRAGGANAGIDRGLRVVSPMTTTHVSGAIICTVATTDVSGTVIGTVAAADVSGAVVRRMTKTTGIARTLGTGVAAGTRVA